jgi:hypothetical protein
VEKLASSGMAVRPFARAPPISSGRDAEHRFNNATLGPPGTVRRFTRRDGILLPPPAVAR